MTDGYNPHKFLFLLEQVLEIADVFLPDGLYAAGCGGLDFLDGTVGHGHRNTKIDHHGFHALMPQHLADLEDIYPILQHMCGHRVTELLRVNVFRHFKTRFPGLCCIDGKLLVTPRPDTLLNWPPDLA